MNPIAISKGSDVLVVGGGIAGLAISHELASRGFRPVVLERDRPASHASAAAAGILAARGVVRSDVPGRMFYTLSLSAYPGWVRRLARESGKSVVLHEGDDWCVFPPGGRCDRFRHRMERESDPALWSESGLDGVPDGLRGSLAPADWRVFRFRGERWLRPAELLPALLDAAVRAGAAVFPDGGDVALEHDGSGWKATCAKGVFRAPVAVVAAGPWTGNVLGPLGWRANLAPVRGQLALVPALHGLDAMVHLEDSMYVIPRGPLSLVGATQEHGQWSEDTTPEGQGDLETGLRRLFPRLDLSGAVERWAGLRPRTRDRMPHVGWLEPGLFLASGHYRSGISMAPRTAEVVADCLEGMPMPSDAEGLSPLRSGGGWRRIDSGGLDVSAAARGTPKAARNKSPL